MDKKNGLKEKIEGVMDMLSGLMEQLLQYGTTEWGNGPTEWLHETKHTPSLIQHTLKEHFRQY